MANDWTVQDNDNFVNIKSGQTLNIDLPIKTENATNDLELFLFEVKLDVNTAKNA